MVDARRSVVRLVDADGRTAGAGLLVARGVVLTAEAATGTRRRASRVDFGFEIDGVRQDLADGLGLALPGRRGRRPVPVAVTRGADGLAVLAPERPLTGLTGLPFLDVAGPVELAGRRVLLVGFAEDDSTGPGGSLGPGTAAGARRLPAQVREVRPDGGLSIQAEGPAAARLDGYLGGPVVDRESGLAIGVLTEVVDGGPGPGRALAAAAGAVLALVPDLQLAAPQQFSPDTDRRLRNARRLNVVLAVLLAGLLVALWFAVAGARSSALAHRAAVSRQLAGRSDRFPAGDDVKALLVAAALTYRATPEASYSARDLLGRDSFRLAGHRGPVQQVSFTPDGSTLVTAGSDGAVRFWDLARRRPAGAITTGGRLDVVDSSAISPDGRTLAVGDITGTVRLFDTRTRSAVAPSFVDRARIAVLGLSFSPDGRTLVTASSDGTIRRLDPATGRQRGRPLAEKVYSAVNSVAVSPDGKHLATAEADGSTRIWDLAARRAIRLEEGGGLAVNAVAYSPNGRLLAAGGVGDTLALWNTATHRRIAAIRTGFGINGLAFSPDGSRVAAAQGDGAVHVWDAGGSFDELENLPGSTSRMLSVAYAPDGRQLAGVGDGGLVQVWDAAAFHQVDVVDLTRAAVNGVGYGVGYGPAGRQLIAAQADGSVHFLDAATHRALGVVRDGAGVNTLAVSPDGRTLAVGDANGGVRFWDTAARRPIGGPLRTTAGGVIGVAFAPDGRQLVVAGGNGDVEFWDRQSRTYHGGLHPTGLEAITGLALSPSGRTLAVAGTDGSAALFDVATRRRVGAEFVGDRGALSGLAFAPDGRSLAVADSSGTVQVWDVATRRPLGSALNAAQDTVNAVAFAPDGRSVLTGGSDGTVRVWDVGNLGRSAGVSGLTAQLCARAGRDLTAAEWSRFLPGEKPRPVCPARIPVTPPGYPGRSRR